SAGAVSLISVNSAGTAAGNDKSELPINTNSPNRVFSIDNRFVFFQSNATNLLSGVTDTNGGIDLFQRDLVTNTTRLVTASGTTANHTGNGGIVTLSDMTENGRFAAFAGLATDYVSGFSDGNGGSSSDVFVRHMPSGTNRLVSFNVAD